jgi:predicted Fe-S protein YdhL (DUF1289 family)
MTDEIWQRDEADSPCVKICMIHPQTRLCIGCRRSISEISDWLAAQRATQGGQ